MSEHPWFPGVNGNSSAHVEGAENSTQLSLIVRVLQNCVSAWKRTVLLLLSCPSHNFVPLAAHAIARSVTAARSSAVQASSSRRQEMRWAIVCVSPQSQSTDLASSR